MDDIRDPVLAGLLTEYARLEYDLNHCKSNVALYAVLSRILEIVSEIGIPRGISYFTAVLAPHRNKLHYSQEVRDKVEALWNIAESVDTR